MATDAALEVRRIAVLLIREGFNATELALALGVRRSQALRLVRFVRR